MRDIIGIILHCSATRPDWFHGKTTAEKVAEIRRWHMEDRGWKDIGYHYLIDRDGALVTGRPLDQTGAHVIGNNVGTIGVCLIGGHGSSVTDEFSDNFTPEQERALRSLLDDLQKQFGKVPVTGHNQYAAKACPGFEAPKWFEGPSVILPSIAMPEPMPAPEPTPVVPETTPMTEKKTHTGVIAIVLATIAAAAYLMKE